jgi:hypothetical protein
MFSHIRSALQRLLHPLPIAADPGEDELYGALVQVGVVPSAVISSTWLPPTEAPTLDQHPWTGGVWLVRTARESFAIRYCAADPFLGSYLPWERCD